MCNLKLQEVIYTQKSLKRCGPVQNGQCEKVGKSRPRNGCDRLIVKILITTIQMNFDS